MLFVGVTFAGMSAFAPLVFAAPAGDPQLKIFTRDRETIETDVNGWLASQQDIIVDFIEDNASVSPMELTAMNLLRDKLKDVLDSLTLRERAVLEQRFGLVDGAGRTLEEVGR